MSVVTAQMVKELREMTLAGMSDCKKALDAALGDMDKAVVILRERGLANAAKKADRVASEGVVTAFVSSNTLGYAFEVNCETDFVTKNDAFQLFITQLQNVVSQKSPSSLEELLKLSFDSAVTVEEKSVQLVATIGEKINVRRFSKVGNGKNYVASYVHGNGKIGVLVEFSGSNLNSQTPDLFEVGKDVALQIAAMKPLYLQESEISSDVIQQEESIIRNKFLAQGKPEAALAKIVPSSLKTWFKEVCLNDQLFVKDDSKTVSNYVLEVGKKFGISDLKIASFVRMELGQGVEKKSEDFAAEVAATVAAAQKH